MLGAGEGPYRLVSLPLCKGGRLSEVSSYTATLREFSAKLRTCKEKVLIAAVTPGPQLSSAIQTLMETVSRYTHGIVWDVRCKTACHVPPLPSDVELFISLSLAECDSECVQPH